MGNLGAQFKGDPASIPPAPGTAPVPPGMVRFNHYTSDEAIPGIREHGLQRSYSEEKYAHGGTESPQIFATAGAPSANLLQARPVVEGWANPARPQRGEYDRPGTMDVGENWRGDPPEEHAKYLEERKSVITFHNDVPANQILAIHEPWHESARYFQKDAGGRNFNGKQFASARSDVARGEHDNLSDDPNYGPALHATKVTNAATVMLGGKL